jgi:uncharacterized protein YfaQ (DUF2300 family)
MMVRLDDFTADRVVPFCAANSLDEVGFCAWIAQAEPGETLVYHRGFLAVDATAVLSKLPADRQRALRQVAAAALRAAEQNLVHLVQARIGPDQFAYIAIARPKPRSSGAALSVHLLEAA